MSKDASDNPGLYKESVRYGRKFDLGNFESLDIEVTIWASLTDTNSHAAMQALWALARNAARFAYIKALGGLNDVSVLTLGAELPSGTTVETVSLSLTRKVNTGKKYENATLGNSLWYNVDGEDWERLISSLWQSVFNNIAAAVPVAGKNPMEEVYLGVEEEVDVE